MDILSIYEKIYRMWLKLGKFVIEKSRLLEGRIKVNGSKNSVLPILAATLLSEQECIIRDVPYLTDVEIMKRLLENLGAKVVWDDKEEIVYCETKKIIKTEADYELVSKMRASFLLMGPLLSRFGRVKIPLPGGCPIGSRPVDLHLKGFASLGAEIKNERGYVEARAKKLKGANIYLDFPSVGATENIMMAAVLAEGQTIIQNCAIEPEVVDLASFLNSMGADVRGTGTDTIRINGVSRLSGCEHTIIPDRIEAGTFMVVAGLAGGNVTIENVVSDHLKPVIAKLREANIAVTETETGINILSDGSRLPTDIKTLPYPGFPTDMQAQFMGMLALTEGTSIVIETVFENRFMHVGELKRMGANIKIEGRSAVVEGVKQLTGTQVKATDLRAGAALILAGLTAEGKTEIGDIYHIERGYFGIDEKLRRIGAKIKKVD